MTLWLLVEGKKNAECLGTSAECTEVLGTRGGSDGACSFLAGGLVTASKLLEERYPSNTGHVLLFMNPEEACSRWPSNWLIGFHDNFLKRSVLRSSVVSCPRGPVRFPPSP